MSDWYAAETRRVDDCSPRINQSAPGPKGDPIPWKEIYAAIDKRAKEWNLGKAAR